MTVNKIIAHTLTHLYIYFVLRHQTKLNEFKNTYTLLLEAMKGD